jgi:hypothetical protein
MPGPEGGIDLDALVAIDVHTHVEVSAVTGRGYLASDDHDSPWTGERSRSRH